MNKIKRKDGVKFRKGDWVTATDYFCLIGKIKKIKRSGLVTFKNISPTGNDIVRHVSKIDHEPKPYTIAYSTEAGYGSSGGDKTRGSYPYFKQMIDAGNL